MNASAYRTSNFIHTLVCSMAQLADVQISVARSVLETEAKLATHFGAPDFPRRYAWNGRTHLFEERVGKAMEVQQRVLGALSEMQTHWIRFVQHNAKSLGERIREELEETGTKTERGIADATELAERALPQGGEPRQIERIGSSQAPGVLYSSGSKLYHRR